MREAVALGRARRERRRIAMTQAGPDRQAVRPTSWRHRYGPLAAAAAGSPLRDLRQIASSATALSTSNPVPGAGTEISFEVLKPPERSA